MDCPQNVIGRVIGRGGETIRELQVKSGAKIQVDQQVCHHYILMESLELASHTV